MVRGSVAARNGPAIPVKTETRMRKFREKAIERRGEFVRIAVVLIA
jgi:hypothetical protein